MTRQSEVDELLAAAESFTVPLRMAQGIDGIALERLRRALHDCAAAWRDQDAVPKIAANVLVDLFLAIDASADLYPDDYKLRVRNVAFEVSDLVRECVAVTGPGAERS